MTYFLLSLTNKCNKRCGYCVVNPWLNNPEFPDKITAADIIAWLGGLLQSGDVAELTGGEPTLFKDLTILLDFLKERKAKIILRTNGAMLGGWRKDYPNMAVVLARHDSDENYMSEKRKYLLPQDLVLNGIPEHLKQKEQDKPVFANDETSPLNRHPFKKSFFLTADGRIRVMPCETKDMGTVWDFKPVSYHCCENCPYMLGAWNLAARIPEGAWSR